MDGFLCIYYFSPDYWGDIYLEETFMTKEYKLQVLAHPNFLPEQSSADENRYIWSYEITIKNPSEDIIQLLNRCWRITDMTGHVEEIRGPGVIGLQPLIKPGKEFVYTSFCQLQTPQGTMEGYYELQNLDEERFIVQIPKFVLTCPGVGKFRSSLH